MPAPRVAKQDLYEWIQRAQRGEVDAYDCIVGRFQDMAVGYGYSILHDFHWAEDAAQEAFLQAYLDLPTLKDPRGFPGWFRKIVFKQCDRLSRRKRVVTVPLEAVQEALSPAPGPAQVVEEAAMRNSVQSEVSRLPEMQREVIALFYMGGYSHAEIGDFLEVPINTVKKRLQSARQRLKERMMATYMDTEANQKPDLTRREALTAMAGTAAVALGGIGAGFKHHAPSRTPQFADEVARAIRDLHAPNPDHDVQKMPWCRLYSSLEEQARLQPDHCVSDCDQATFNALLKETQAMYPDDPVLQVIPTSQGPETALSLLVSVGQANHATCRGPVLKFAPMQRKAIHFYDDLARMTRALLTQPAPENTVVIFNTLLRAVTQRFVDNPNLKAIPKAYDGQSITSLEAVASRLEEAMKVIEQSMTESQREQPW